MGAKRYSAGALALFLGIAVWGCAAAAAGPEGPEVALAREALPGLEDRRCHYVSAHDEVPSFARLARPGTRGNIGLLGYYAAPTDTVVLSVRYDVEGRLAWVRAIKSSLLPDQVTALEGLLLATLNERGPADWGIRLSVIGGQLSTAEPSILCPIEARRGGERMPLATPITSRDIRALERVRGRRFPIQVTVNEQGRIMDVRFPRTPGETAVEQFLFDWILGMQYQPKLHDGIPLVGTIEQSIYIPLRR